MTIIVCMHNGKVMIDLPVKACMGDLVQLKDR